MSERTAIDVLLALEKKETENNFLLKSLDLNIKVLSNKITEVISLIKDAPSYEASSPDYVQLHSNQNQLFPAIPNTTPSPSIQNMKVEEEWKPAIPLTTEEVPVGFRRTSRPETFEDPRITASRKNTPTPSLPVPEMKVPVSIAEEAPMSNGSRMPISQRITDRNGKAMFMADVEIIDAQGHTEAKIRTNGVGKWQASLVPGRYRVNISKFDTATKQRIQVAQDLVVDEKTPKELQTVIIKG